MYHHGNKIQYLFLNFYLHQLPFVHVSVCLFVFKIAEKVIDGSGPNVFRVDQLWQRRNGLDLGHSCPFSALTLLVG